MVILSFLKSCDMAETVEIPANCDVAACPPPLREKLFSIGQAGGPRGTEGVPEALAVARQFLAEEKFPLAAEWLRQVHLRAPDEAEVNFLYGFALSQSQRWYEAAPLLKAAAEMQPASAHILRCLGRNAVKMGCYREGAAALKRMIDRGPVVRRLWSYLRRMWSRPPAHTALSENPEIEDLELQWLYAEKRRADISRASEAVEIGRPNPLWRNSQRGRKLKVRREPIISSDTRVFAMGSCFAVELRDALRRRGFPVYPQYAAIPFEQHRSILNLLPDSENINHYDTFTIRQEFEMAFAEGHFPAESFWKVEKSDINKTLDVETVWQDPHRRNVFSLDRDTLVDVSRKIDACVREGIDQADVYVITLGLIETWRNQAGDYHACSCPGTAGGGRSAEFHLSTFEEDYENIRRVCELIRDRYPEKHIILTVSPVALERTFTDSDVVIANLESKCQLRAVAAQIRREFENVHYLPSFELFIYHDLHHDDGRHASRDGVEIVMDAFARIFLTDDANQLGAVSTVKP
jgi:tetratricopeptide (TPR) repeat protein